MLHKPRVLVRPGCDSGVLTHVCRQGKSELLATVGITHFWPPRSWQSILPVSLFAMPPTSDRWPCARRHTRPSCMPSSTQLNPPLMHLPTEPLPLEPWYLVGSWVDVSSTLSWLLPPNGRSVSGKKTRENRFMQIPTAPSCSSRQDASNGPLVYMQGVSINKVMRAGSSMLQVAGVPSATASVTGCS